ncbi:MAG: hypothetical protein M1837_002157 [Sclerophora amabilis]|nr:MAG: hypothetical protein M1837_002157 [Sclerophora amabilis]
MSKFFKSKKDDRSVTVETRSISSSVAASDEPSSTAIPGRRDRKGRPLTDPSYKWGRTPNVPLGDDWKASDHPVNNMSEEEQAKLRAKGINPALKAEMDEKVNNTKKGGWWINLSTIGGPR